MPISQHQREQERIAGPRLTRGLATFYLIGAAIGLLIGIVWVIAGILHFHRLW